MGWWEQDAEGWGVATTVALAEVDAQVGSLVSAIGLTYQLETFVGVDDAWRSIRPAIVWMDDHAHAEVAQIRADFGEDQFHALTVKPLSMTSSLSKIMWLRFDSANRHDWLPYGTVAEQVTMAYPPEAWPALITVPS